MKRHSVSTISSFNSYNKIVEIVKTQLKYHAATSIYHTKIWTAHATNQCFLLSAFHPFLSMYNCTPINFSTLYYCTVD